MPCACNGASSKQPEPMFEVTLPDGSTFTLNEHDAKVKITMAGGGTRRPIRT